MTDHIVPPSSNPIPAATGNENIDSTNLLMQVARLPQYNGDPKNTNVMIVVNPKSMFDRNNYIKLDDVKVFLGNIIIGFRSYLSSSVSYVKYMDVFNYLIDVATAKEKILGMSTDIARLRIK